MSGDSRVDCGNLRFLLFSRNPCRARYEREYRSCTVLCEQVREGKVPEILTDENAEPPVLRIKRANLRAAAEVPVFFEHPVRRRIRLPVDGTHLSPLEEKGGIVESERMPPLLQPPARIEIVFPFSIRGCSVPGSPRRLSARSQFMSLIEYPVRLSSGNTTTCAPAAAALSASAICFPMVRVHITKDGVDLCQREAEFHAVFRRDERGVMNLKGRAS